MASCSVMGQHPSMLQLQKGNGTAPAEGPEAGMQQHIPIELSQPHSLPQQPTKRLQGQEYGQQDLATVEARAGNVLGLHGTAEAGVAGILQGTQQQADTQQHRWHQREEEAGVKALLDPGLGDGSVAFTVAPQHGHPGRSPAVERREPMQGFRMGCGTSCTEGLTV